MNRGWIVVALGLWMGGCADGVDDPLPPAPTAPQQAPGETTTMSGDIPGGEATSVDLDAPPLYVSESELGPIPEPGLPARPAH